MSVLHRSVGIIFLVILVHGVIALKNSSTSGSNNIHHRRKVVAVIGTPVTRQESQDVLGRYVEGLLSIPMGKPGWNCWTRKVATNSCVYARKVVSIETDTFLEYMGQPDSVRKIILVFAQLKRIDEFAKKDPRTIPNGVVRIILKEGAKTMKSKRNIALAIYNELARNWFDKLQTPKSLKDNGWLWMGLRIYFQHVVLTKVEPSWRREAQMVLHDLQSQAFGRELESYNQPLSKSRSPLGKAQCIIRMIWHVMGPRNIKVGLQKFAAMRTEKKERSPQDFFNALASTADNGGTKYFLEHFLESSWVKQQGYPIVHVSQSKSAPGTWNVFQTLLPLKFGNAPTEFRLIPLNYATQTTHEYSDTEPSQWLSADGYEHKLQVQPGNNDLVIFNKKQTGYYRVNYADWSSVVNLNTENYDNIARLNRAQLFDDSYQLVKLGILTSVKWFLRLTPHLVRDRAITSWVPAVRAFKDLWDNLKDTAISKSLMSYVFGLMKPFMGRVGYSESPRDKVLKGYVRPELIELVCAMGLKTCADETLKRLIDNIRGKNDISPNLRDVIFREGMRTANATIWEEAYSLYKSKPESHGYILSSLGYNSNPQIIRRFLGNLIGRNFATAVEDDFGMKVLESVHKGNGIEPILNFIVDESGALGWNTLLWSWYSNCLAHMRIIITTTDQQQKMALFCSANANGSKDYLCHQDKWLNRSPAFKIPDNSEQDVREFLKSSLAQLISSKA